MRARSNQSECLKQAFIALVVVALLVFVSLAFTASARAEAGELSKSQKITVHLKARDSGRIIYSERVPRIVTNFEGVEKLLIDYWLNNKVSYKDLSYCLSQAQYLSLREKALLVALLSELEDPRASSIVSTQECYDIASKSMIPEEVYYAGLILKRLGVQLPERSFSLGALSDWDVALLAELYPDLLPKLQETSAKDVKDPSARARLEALAGDAYEALRLVGDVDSFEDAYTLRLIKDRAFIIRGLVVEPKVVVLERSRIASLDVCDVYGRPLKANASIVFKSATSTILVDTPLGYRVVGVRHVVLGEGLTVTAVVESANSILRGMVLVPEGLRLKSVRVGLAGSDYTFNGPSFEVEHYQSGKHVVTIEALLDYNGQDVLLSGSGEVFLRQEQMPATLQLAIPIALALGGAIPCLGVERKRVATYSALGAVLILTIRLVLPETPITVFLIASIGVIVGLAIFGARKAIKPLTAYLLLVGALLACALWIGNPLVLILTGIGNGMMIVAMICYPSEWRTHEKLLLGVNAFYALLMLLAGGLLAFADKVASLVVAQAPLTWGVVEAITAFVSSLIVYSQAVPILVPALYLAQLWWRRSRAKATEEYLKELMSTWH